MAITTFSFMVVLEAENAETTNSMSFLAYSGLAVFILNVQAILTTKKL